MRDIKFRQWDSVHKRMIEGAEIVSNGHFRGFSLSNFKDNIPMQYTGLKDKNSNEIYEGDILSPGYAEDELFVVVFDESKARFAEQRISKKYPTEEVFIMDGSFLRIYLHSQRLEIIGNIYENPELLKD